MTRQDYEDVVVSVAHPPGRKSGSGVALERRAYVEAPDASHAGSDSRMRGEAQDASQGSRAQDSPFPASPTKKGARSKECSTTVKDHPRSIQVHVRVRPLLRRELDSGVCIAVHEDANGIKILSDKSSLESNYDHVWQETASQSDVFASVQDCADSVLQGFNNTIFAYGQTGTGKTHTILGSNYVSEADATQVKKHRDELRAASSEEAGITPRMMLRLYERIENLHSAGADVKVFLSYLEVYNEKVYDLLSSETKNVRGDDKDMKQGRVTLEVRDQGVHGVSAFEARSAAEAMSLVRLGNRTRSVRHTRMNTHSSRSHAILQLMLERKQNGRVARSKLNLVDLAGSERWDDHDMSAARIKEMTSINQGLSALASVVAALQAKALRELKNPDDHGGASNFHVPYRDSKLTHLLMDSLGGNCRTTMIATISPSMLSAGENVSTMRFADRVRAIRNRAVAIEANDPNAVLEAKEAEIQRLKALLSLVAGSDATELSYLKEAFDSVNRELEASRRELREARRVLDEERQLRERLQRTVPSTWSTPPDTPPGVVLPDIASLSASVPLGIVRQLSRDEDMFSPLSDKAPSLPPVANFSESQAAGGSQLRSRRASEARQGPIVNPNGALASMLQSHGVSFPGATPPDGQPVGPASAAVTGAEQIGDTMGCTPPPNQQQPPFPRPQGGPAPLPPAASRAGGPGSNMKWGPEAALAVQAEGPRHGGKARVHGGPPPPKGVPEVAAAGGPNPKEAVSSFAPLPSGLPHGQQAPGAATTFAAGGPAALVRNSGPQHAAPRPSATDRGSGVPGTDSRQASAASTAQAPPAQPQLGYVADQPCSVVRPRSGNAVDDCGQRAPGAPQRRGGDSRERESSRAGPAVASAGPKQPEHPEAAAGNHRQRHGEPQPEDGRQAGPDWNPGADEQQRRTRGAPAAHRGSDPWQRESDEGLLRTDAPWEGRGCLQQWEVDAAGDAGAVAKPCYEKEFIAIGGILGEITKIRSELRGIINNNPGSLGHGGRHPVGGYGGGYPYPSEQPDYPRAQQAQPYRDGSPHRVHTVPKAKPTAIQRKGSSKYVHSVYGVPPEHSTARKDKGRTGSSAPPAGLPSSVSALHEGVPTGRLSGRRRSSPRAHQRWPGSEVYFSSKVHSAALGPFAQEDRRHADPPRSLPSRSPAPATTELSRIPQQQRSNQRTERRLTSKLEPMAAGARTKGFPSGSDFPQAGERSGRSTLKANSAPRKPHGIPPDMDVGTWMYIMGPHANSARAAQLARLETVAGFGMVSDKAPAMLLR